MKIEYAVKLDIVKEMQDMNKGSYTFSEMSQIISDKLREISTKGIVKDSYMVDDISWMRRTLIDRFFDLAKDQNATLEDFDYCMKKLFKWGDMVYKISYSKKTIFKVCNILN